MRRRWRSWRRRWARLARRWAPVVLVGALVTAGVVVFAEVWPGAARAPLEIPPVPPPGAAPTADVAAWADGLAEDVAVPRTALAAYARAQRRIAVDDPDCGLTWTTLAGIGSVESDHGRFAGAVLAEDGTSSPPIVGVPLDGAPGLAEIPDTDDGRLDGDTEYDRAVGPLQFIPETWQRWAADGDGDGVRDVFDVDDAALAAGRYLCRAGGDLTSAPGWAAAVFAYNRSGEYADDVRRAAATYAARSTG